MCSFIGLKLGKDYNDNYQDYILCIIEENLSDKGGDVTNLLIHRDDEIVTINIDMRDGEFWYSKNDKELFKFKQGDIIFGFSRLTPETESNNLNRLSKIPPYKTIFGKYIAAHGTIPLKGIDIDMVDTEMLKFEENLLDSIRKVEKLNGKASIIEYNPELKEFNAIHNGLGLTEIRSGREIDIFIGITNNIYDKAHELVHMAREIEPNRLYTTDYNSISMPKGRSAYIKDKEIVVSLCSGGMDAILSTTNYLYMRPMVNIEAIHIDYFNWGTRAAVQEIEAVGKFAKFVQEIPNIARENVKVDIIPSKDYFREILNFAKTETTRLIDSTAKGEGENESEEAISYVPLRNTFLLMALVAKYEAMYPNRKVTFIFGGNLTEGMVYSDNSVNYIAKMNQLIKLAGQKTSNFQLIAPFAKHTKTKMIEIFKNVHGDEMLEKLLNIAFSCYFPKPDGSPCNECGSCNLRNLSQKRSNLVTMDGKIKVPTPIPAGYEGEIIAPSRDYDATGDGKKILMGNGTQINHC